MNIQEQKQVMYKVAEVIEGDAWIESHFDKVVTNWYHRIVDILNDLNYEIRRKDD